MNQNANHRAPRPQACQARKCLGLLNLQPIFDC